MTETPAGKAPVLTRLLTWADERFPFKNAPAFFLFYLAAAAVGGRVTSGAVALGWRDVVSCVAVYCLFLLLRVFDEHKDYADDLVHHPDRVLQRGVITLADLKVVGAGCFAVTLAWSLVAGGGVSTPLVAWAIMMIWAGLMAVEFFAHDWLKSRFVVYALSHMAIMPLIAWWCVTLHAPGAVATPEIWLLALLFFLTGLAFEVGRKTRGPEEERDGVDSYTKVFGVRGSPLVIAAIVVLVGVVIAALMLQVGPRPITIWFFAPLALGACLALLFVAAFLRAPSAKGRKGIEAALGVLALLGYGGLIAAALSAGASAS